MAKYLIARANFLIFAGLIGLLALLGVLIWSQSTATQLARAWVQHTDQVILTVEELRLRLDEAESSQRGYLLTDDPEYLRPYEAALGRISGVQGELLQLTVDNLTQQARIRALEPVLRRKLEVLGRGIQLRRETGTDAALGLLRSDLDRVLIAQIRRSLSDIQADEQRLLKLRLAAAKRAETHTRWLILGGATLAVLALLSAAWSLNDAWARSYRAEGEQRALALRLRSSLDSLSQGVAVFDANRRLTHWNECFQVLLDLPRAMVRSGTPYAAFAEHAAEAGSAVLERDEQLRPSSLGSRRTDPEPVVYEHARGDGHVLEIRRAPMPDGGFVLTISDMSKRAQAEAVLREAQKMQAIGQLTGGIAHDFNNLLTVILGNLEFTRSKLGEESPAAVRIDRAIWAAQRGAALTRQLLAFARKQALAPVPVDLSVSLRNIIPLLQRTIGENIDVHVVDSVGLWPAMADGAQLESAVLNLALNARDAMPDGGLLTVELANMVLDEDYARAHAEVSAGEYVMFAVSDTGHGMTPQVAARVFEPFFTTKPEGEGTGLGLAMVFGFVKQSGGHVKIYSEPGEGTSVKIYLPRAVGATARASGHPGAPAELPRGSATVLVVEDEPAVREIAVAMLSDLGYRVLEASDGEEGLRTFGANADAVDLLLTDVVLPGNLRGREMAERIASLRPEVPVLYMSGYTENSIVHHGRLDEGVALITKPFQREQLARKVAEMLGAEGTTAAATDGKVVELRGHRRE